MKTLKEIKDRAKEDLKKQFFDEEYGYPWQSNKGNYHKEVLSFLDSLITQTVKATKVDSIKILKELLDKGHGGGNWRRLVIQALSDQKKKEKEFMGKE